MIVSNGNLSYWFQLRACHQLKVGLAKTKKFDARSLTLFYLSQSADKLPMSGHKIVLGGLKHHAGDMMMMLPFH